MTINNRQTYMDNLWDWGFLDACFGDTGIRVSDIDGVVERRGRFLYLETKGPEKSIPAGQKIMFNALVRNTHNHVLIIWGKRNQPEEMQFWGKKKIPANGKDVQNVVRRWFEYVDVRIAFCCAHCSRALGERVNFYGEMQLWVYRISGEPMSGYAWKGSGYGLIPCGICHKETEWLVQKGGENG